MVRNKTKGPRLTRQQAESLLSRHQRIYGQSSWSPTRAYRVFHAYQITVGETGLTKGNRIFRITGPPTKRTAYLTRWNNKYQLVAVVPCRDGWRAIISPTPIDAACWI
jgi:hypothetical protein